MAASRKFTIEIANGQSRHAVPRPLLRTATREVLIGEGIRSATISLAVVDDSTMQELNRKYLRHDYPTDVLSFVLERDGETLDGEIIVSADTAARSCHEFGWSAQNELVLYVIHGMLHLVGFDDHNRADRRRMRDKEAKYLARLRIAAANGARRASRVPARNSRKGK